MIPDLQLAVAYLVWTVVGVLWAGLAGSAVFFGVALWSVLATKRTDRKKTAHEVAMGRMQAEHLSQMTGRCRQS